MANVLQHSNNGLYCHVINWLHKTAKWHIFAILELKPKFSHNKYKKPPYKKIFGCTVVLNMCNSLRCCITTWVVFITWRCGPVTCSCAALYEVYNVISRCLSCHVLLCQTGLHFVAQHYTTACRVVLSRLSPYRWCIRTECYLPSPLGIYLHWSVWKQLEWTSSVKAPECWALTL